MLGDHGDAGPRQRLLERARAGRSTGALELGERHDLATALDLVARSLNDAVQNAQLGASLAVSETRRSSAPAAAPLSIAASAARTPSQAVRAPRRVDRRPGVEHREVTRRTLRRRRGC